jgi:hypothetical protein
MCSARVKLFGFAASLFVLGIACRSVRPSRESPTELLESRRSDNSKHTTIAVPPDFQIRLERSQKMTPAREYSVTISASGRVHFDGKGNVQVSGPVDSQIHPAQVAMLARLIDDSVFWCVDEDSLALRNHIPWTTLSVHSDGRVQTVLFCWAWGWGELPPDFEGAEQVEELSRIADTIECVSGAYQWVGVAPDQ